MRKRGSTVAYRDFLDFELLIERSDPDYRALATSPVGEERGRFTLPVPNST